MQYKKATYKFLLLLLILFMGRVGNIWAGSPPTADFNIDNNTVCVNENVTFTDASTANTSSWSWNFGAGASTSTETAQGPHTVTYSIPGTKTITLIASNVLGSSSISKTITVNDLPTASIGITETSGTTANDGTVCAGDQATLTASGGTSYSWSSGESTASITKGAGTYTVTVTDGNGCGATSSVTIIETALPTASISITETSGTTNNDGILCAGDQATLTASGGTSYSWSSGESTASITKGAGTYTVTVTNGNGCEATSSVTIIETALPTASIGITETSGATANDGTVCAGDQATLTASGGTSYSWSSGESTASITKGAGTYTVTVTNGNGCEATSSVTIIETALPTASIGITETSGTTANDGTVCAGDQATLTASGGTSYSWSSGESTASITKGAGTYTVTVTDGNGCEATSSVTIIETPLPNNTSSGFTGNTICSGSNGVINFNAINASFTAPYSIEYTDGTTTWTQVIPTAAATSFNVAVNPIVTTNYSLVSITNGDGCTRTSGFGDATARITVNALPTIIFDNLSAEACKGDNLASMTYSATTESPDRYSINFDATAEGQGFVDVSDATLDAGAIDIVIPIGAIADTYNATVTVKNNTTGCESTAYNISVIVHPLPNTSSIQTN